MYTQQTLRGFLSGGTLMVRPRTDPAAWQERCEAVRAVNPESVPTTRTMESVMAESLGAATFPDGDSGGFAVLALVLAAVGLYGVLSYMVTANRSQIGIRLALGASPGPVFRMITTRALVLAGVGAALGLVGCLAVRKVLVAMLYGIGPNDPLTIAGAVAVLLLVTVAAAYFPSRRAMRTDPMVALREE